MYIWIYMLAASILLQLHVYIMCCSYDQLLADKEAVEQEYILYRKEVKHTKAGASTKVKA